MYSRHYGIYLKAQETSPTVILAYASIGDEGAVEVSRLLASSPYLLRLDLTGCNISSVGAMHLAEALRQSVTLESLVLKHNSLTSGPYGEAGLVAICQAAHDSPCLRHLDLRHNFLEGTSAAEHIGSILQGNQQLSHLELSWNELGPSAGEVLLGHIRATSGLFDCQLSGCRLAEETKLEIAELLLRNRKAKGADTQAGPFKGTWASVRQDKQFDSSHAFEKQALAPKLQNGVQESASEWHSRMLELGVAGNIVVTEERTREYIVRLVEYRQQRLERCEAGMESSISSRVSELLQYLEENQQRSCLLHQDACKSLQRTQLIADGFKDRETRYRCDIAAARDRLLEFASEHRQLQAIHGRLLSDLNLLRENLDQARLLHSNTQTQAEDDQLRAETRLAELKIDQKELSQQLDALHRRGDPLDSQTAKLRKRAEEVRERVINELEA